MTDATRRNPVKKSGRNISRRFTTFRENMKREAKSVLSFIHRDADEVASFMSSYFGPIKIEPLEKQGTVSMIGQVGSLQDLGFGKARYHQGLRLVPKQHDPIFFFCFPKLGDMNHVSGSRTRAASPGQAIHIDAEETDFLEHHAGYVQIALTVSKAVIIKRLTLMLDRPVSTKIVFSPLVDSKQRGIAALEDVATYVVESRFGETVTETPLASARMSQLIADMIIETWPNNFSIELQTPPKAIHPRHVKIAKEYIDAHPLNPLGVEGLARLSGVSVRALQYGFRDFLGVSIGQYERRCRLEGARQAISSGAHDSVRDVALLWGFSNVHRFSEEFKAAFGVTPRELRRNIF